MFSKELEEEELEVVEEVVSSQSLQEGSCCEELTSVWEALYLSAIKLKY